MKKKIFQVHLIPENMKSMNMPGTPTPVEFFFLVENNSKPDFFYCPPVASPPELGATKRTSRETLFPPSSRPKE